MTAFVRLLPFAAADGATNMAADEAMLETAAERGLASLRFYTWSEPTLTLGYFQASPDRERHPTLATLPWVRRSTGGAGILHHHELTYSFALPSAAAWKSEESWICRFHHLVQDALGEVGVTSRMVICGEERKLGDVLCFLHQTPGDLLLNGSKIAGSAQRKLRGALLQHGSLILQRSESAPMLPGMEELAGHALFSPRELAECLAQRFVENTCTRLEPGDWSTEEHRRILEIRAEKYANAAWNGKR